MYFKNRKKIKYNFGNNQKENLYEVVNMFSRPIISEPDTNYDLMKIDEPLDQLSRRLYDDSYLFYTNILLNNILNNNDLPLNQLTYESNINSIYSGYAFHILETPTLDLIRGDIIILKNDIELNSCTDPNNPSCFTTFAVVEKWDPVIKKIWCKTYTIGTVGAKTEKSLFKERNKFRIYRRDINGGFDLSGIQISNESVFDQAVSENKYSFVSGVFTMRRVTEYLDSLHIFETNNMQVNPKALNVSSSGSNLEQIAGTYNSSLLNTECSILDAYILSSGSEKDSTGKYYRLSSGINQKTENTTLTEENNDKRMVNILKRSIVGSVAEKSRKY